MQKQFSIPLIFLFIAACIGLLLRWHFIVPFPWLKYPYWLHAHSHIMFLGWVFNVLFLAFVRNYNLPSRYHTLFILMQILLTGMLVSFPIQGYGIVSIIISTVHTFSVWIFSFWLFKDLRKTDTAISKWFAKGSLILFIVSSLGPFALGALMANGLGQSEWYYFAVYYYLHFQYNGVFIFGLLSLFYRLVEENGIPFDLRKARTSGLLLFFSLFPSYFLSTLFANPGVLFNIIGLAGAILQLLSLYYFIVTLRKIRISFDQNAQFLMTISLIAFILKAILQLISAHPTVARLALEVRAFTIAYLHLVLIGVVTFFLLAWYLEKRLLKARASIGIGLLIIGFVGSELAMISSGIPRLSFPHITTLLFIFSTILVLGVGFLVFQFIFLKQNSEASSNGRNS